MNKEILEAVLKKSISDSKIKRIIDVKWESALPKGENYLSTIQKITVKAVLGSGRISKKSFIAKVENAGVAAETFRSDLNMYKGEASMYANVLKKMDYLIEELEDTEGPHWCEFIHFSPTNGIILLEDLKASGFLLAKRSEALDLDHARLVLRSLGRFHAMGKVLEGRGLISKDEFRPFIFLYEETYIRNMVHGGRLGLIRAMKATWGEEWSETAEKLSKFTLEDFIKKVQDSGNFDDKTFKCLNHGDCWSNNMMFKYSWDKRPIDVRFVDYQISHYDSPCVDVIYFIYTSIKPDLRRQNYASLVEYYHQSLTSSLDKFGYKGSKPSLDDINKAMDHLEFFGISVYLAFFPVFQTVTHDGLDIEQVFKTRGEHGFKTSIFSEEGIKEKIGEEVKRIVELQKIDNYSK